MNVFANYYYAEHELYVGNSGTTKYAFQWNVWSIMEITVAVEWQYDIGVMS